MVAIRAAIKLLRNRVHALISRAVLTSKPTQQGGKVFVQVKTKSGTKSDVELITPYGFRSIPKPGARGIYHAPSGAKNNGMVTDMDDKRFGKFNLSEGDVVVYNSDGSRTIYSGSDITTIATGIVKTIVGDAELSIKDGEIKITVGGTAYTFTATSLSTTGKIISNGKVLDTHIHGGVETGAGSTLPPT